MALTVDKSACVLMIGPGEGVGGGISSLVEAFLPGLQKRVCLHYFPTVKNRPLKDSGKVSLFNIRNACRQYIRFIRIISQCHPCIIHLHTSQGIAWWKDTFYVLVGRLFHCHIILHMHGGNFDKLNEGDPRLIQLYTRRILGFADAVIAVSAEWKNRLAKLIPPERIYLFKNCIDIHQIQNKNTCCATDQVTLLFLGRIGEQKGAFDLVEAVHSLQPERLPMHVLMVGPEEQPGDRVRLEKLLEEYQLTNTIELVGGVAREKALQLYGEAGLFVLPSYYEGLPMVILEALAAGLPIVATPVGGIPEFVRDGYNGFLTPIGDVPALACKLRTLVQDLDLRVSMGKRSRQMAEQELDVDLYVDQLIELYTSILAK